ncbi:MAG: ubiquinol oxidase subunit II [Pseudomonadota bacterium]
MRTLSLLCAFLLLCLLPGCNLVVMDPSGDVASQQSDLIVYATILMLIVIIPVILLTLFFAFYYRASNTSASYEPDWDHSISLEIVIWSVPLAIIICLAGLTWVATHRLNPYGDLTRISATQAVDPDVEPLTIQAVAMDWKWMFLYPEQGIATVNEVAVIVDRPVEWHITSTTVMNAFYVPAMAGMIYGMPGMQTELNAVMNAPGTYDGFSANYSGAGFSHMRFDLKAVDEAGFDAWVDGVRAGGEGILDRPMFLDVEQPSIDAPVRYFERVEEGLWDRIVNLCVGEDRLCQNDMMMVDALGGGGLDGLWNRELFAGICAADDPGVILALVKPNPRLRHDETLAAAFRQALLPEARDPREGAN